MLWAQQGRDGTHQRPLHGVCHAGSAVALHEKGSAVLRAPGLPRNAGNATNEPDWLACGRQQRRHAWLPEASVHVHVSEAGQVWVLAVHAQSHERLQQGRVALSEGEATKENASSIVVLPRGSGPLHAVHAVHCKQASCPEREAVAAADGRRVDDVAERVIVRVPLCLQRREASAVFLRSAPHIQPVAVEVPVPLVKARSPRHAERVHCVRHHEQLAC